MVDGSRLMAQGWPWGGGGGRQPWAPGRAPRYPWSMSHDPSLIIHQLLNYELIYQPDIAKWYHKSIQGTGSYAEVNITRTSRVSWLNQSWPSVTPQLYRCFHACACARGQGRDSIRLIRSRLVQHERLPVWYLFTCLYCVSLVIVVVGGAICLFAYGVLELEVCLWAENCSRAHKQNHSKREHLQDCFTAIESNSLEFVPLIDFSKESLTFA